MLGLERHGRSELQMCGIAAALVSSSRISATICWRAGDGVAQHNVCAAHLQRRVLVQKLAHANARNQMVRGLGLLYQRQQNDDTDDAATDK